MERALKWWISRGWRGKECLQIELLPYNSKRGVGIVAEIEFHAILARGLSLYSFAGAAAAVSS